MLLKTKKYSFNAKIWKYDGPAGWYFVTLPKELAIKIRKHHGFAEEGWGRLTAVAKIGNTNWKSAIWFDSKAKSYLLPIKAIIRKAEKLKTGIKIKVQLEIEKKDIKSFLLKAI